MINFAANSLNSFKHWLLNLREKWIRGRVERGGSFRENEAATSQNTQNIRGNRNLGTQQSGDAGLSDNEKNSFKPQSTSQTYQEGGSISTSGEHRSSDVHGNGTVNNGVGLKLTDLNTTLYWS